MPSGDRKSTRLNSSHTEIYTLSLHDALPISAKPVPNAISGRDDVQRLAVTLERFVADVIAADAKRRSEEHTSELQSHRDLHSFPTRRSSDLRKAGPERYQWAR